MRVERILAVRLDLLGVSEDVAKFGIAVEPGDGAEFQVSPRTNLGIGGRGIDRRGVEDVLIPEPSQVEFLLAVQVVGDQKRDLEEQFAEVDAQRMPRRGELL